MEVSEDGLSELSDSDVGRWDDGPFLSRLSALNDRLKKIEHVEAIDVSTVALDLLETQKAAFAMHASVDALEMEEDMRRVLDHLTDIGDAYREIEAHLRNVSFFRYLFVDEDSGVGDSTRES